MMKMGLVKKSIKREEFKEILESKCVTQEYQCEDFEGTIGLLKILKIQHPMTVQHEDYEVTILDENYFWLQLAPRNEHWWLTVLFDDKKHLIESYFDITKENDFSNPLNPTFIDMRLDITISRERGIKILDEEELKDALLDKLITKEEYELAYEVCRHIIQKYNENYDAYYAFIETLFKQFMDRVEKSERI